MTSLILATTKIPDVTMMFALEWLSWIILTAGLVACMIAVLIKLLYFLLSLFPKGNETQNTKH